MTEQNYTIIQQNANKFQNVCNFLLHLARDQRQTKALACYYLLKQNFQNSRIYNHRSRMGELAAIVGVSQRTLYNYFAWMQGAGIIAPQDGHLLMLGTSRLKRMHGERHKFQIKVTDSETIQTIEARLMGKLLEQHARRIEHHKRIQRFKRRYTRTRNTLIKGCSETGPGYSLSIRNIQRLFNLGRNKAVSAILLLNDLGVIHTTKSRPQATAKAPREALKHMDDMPGFFFIRAGILYVQFGNRHELLEHPPAQRDLTYRQYTLLLARSLQKTTQHYKGY